MRTTALLLLALAALACGGPTANGVARLGAPAGLTGSDEQGAFGAAPRAPDLAPQTLPSLAYGHIPTRGIPPRATPANHHPLHGRDTGALRLVSSDVSGAAAPTGQGAGAGARHPRADGPTPRGSVGPLTGAQALALTDAQLAKRVRSNLASLGSISVGKTNAGALVNGVKMPPGNNWLLMDPNRAWGTRETVHFLQVVINKVARQFPGTHKVRLGHISAKHGGHLNPHKSHQSGRDVDVGYYYKDGSKVRWYRRANARNLDVKRTWALVRALVTDTDVEYIFINSSIQKLLKEYALASGEDRSWLDSLFQYRSKHAWPIIRHVHGHDTHLHVRFYNRVAQQLGVRAHRWLARRGIVKPYTRYLRHRARRGDLLGNLAKRYGTTVAAIQKINHLRNNRIRAGRTYLIPKKVKRRIRKPPPLSIPPRRLPPPRPAKTAASGGQRQRRAAR